MATITWLVMRHHKKNDGTYNPKIRISHNGTSAYIPTCIFTDLVKFKKGASSGTVTSGKLIDELNSLVKKYRDIINDYQEVVSTCVCAKELVSLIERKSKNNNIDFISYARTYIEKIAKEGTRINRKTAINSLCHYLKETTNEESLNIKLLTSNFLRKYESWLRQDRVLIVKGKPLKRKAVSDTGIHNFMMAIQVIFNNALGEFNDYEIGDIVIVGNPFKAYKVPAGGLAEKRAVSADVIRKIFQYTTPKSTGRDVFARDIFMLSFFLAGMNSVDLFSCTKLSNGRIEYCRTKTKDSRKDNAYISIPVINEAMKIIEKHKSISGEYVLNLHERYINRASLTCTLQHGMKAMCTNLGIDPIQFYSARHSFATIARNDCNVSKDDIALCLNHSSGHSITDTYIKQDFSRIDGVIKKVVDFVFGKDEEEKEKAGG